MSLPEFNRPIGVSSWSWHEPFYFDPMFTLFDVPAALATTGIVQIELNDFMLPPPRLSRVRERWRPLWPHYPAAWWRYTRGNLFRLKQALTAAGLRCICWTLDTDLTVDPAYWVYQERYIADGVWVAHYLGEKRIRLTLSDNKVGDYSDLDQRVIERLITIANRYPQTEFLVENHGGFTADIDRMLAIVAAVKEQAALGVCFDPGNVAVDQQAEMWPRLAAVADHFHVKTRTFTSEGDEATLDYDILFALLNEQGYQGYLVIEYEGNEVVLDGISHSQKLVNKKMR